MGVALLFTGGVVGLLSGTSPATRGLRQLAIGMGAAGVTYLLGMAFGAVVGERDGPEFRDRGPRHSRRATALRIIRNLAAAAVIAAGAFLTAGLVYGDPRFTGLFEVSRGTGNNAGHSAENKAGSDLQAQPQVGQKSGQPAVPAGEDRTDTPPPGLEEQDHPLGAARETGGRQHLVQVPRNE